MNYTEEQRAAIADLEGNLQLIACAGSGKTQVISARIVELLKQSGVTPANVVAFTFTEKAAAELKARIYRLHQEAFGHIHGLGDMFVGTIHAFALGVAPDRIATVPQVPSSQRGGNPPPSRPQLEQEWPDECQAAQRMAISDGTWTRVSL